MPSDELEVDLLLGVVGVGVGMVLRSVCLFFARHTRQTVSVFGELCSRLRTFYYCPFQFGDRKNHFALAFVHQLAASCSLSLCTTYLSR
jgi:hypothetical protein